MSTSGLHPVTKKARTATVGKARPRAGAKRQTLADLVGKVVDEGATTVEEIHKAIAALPLDVLERIDGFEALEDVRRIQERSIGAVYDVIRRVNREVTQLANELLPRAKPKRVSARTSRSRS